MIKINQFIIPERLKWRFIPFENTEISKGKRATFTIYKKNNVLAIDFKDKSYIGYKDVRLRARFIWILKAIANMVNLEVKELG